MNQSPRWADVFDPAGDRLDSWKEIAAYLKRDVSTVQRWEKGEGLPVRRQMHKERGSVFAFRKELDEWRNNHRVVIDAEGIPRPDELASWSAAREWRKKPMALALVGTAVIATALAAGLMFTRGRPEALRVSAMVQPLGAGRVFAKATTARQQLRLIPVRPRPMLLALSPDGTELYVTHDESDTLSVVSVVAASVKQRIKLGGYPSAIVVARDGTRAYAGLHTGDLDVIDLASKQVTHVMMGGPVIDLALTADGKRLYLAMLHAGLRRLDTATLQASRIPSVVCPQYLALTPDQKRLYVNYQCGGPLGREGHDSIEVFDVATERSVATITGLPNVGGKIQVSPDGAHVWADGVDACSHPRYDHRGCPRVPGGVLNVIRTADHRLVRSIGTPAAEQGVGGLAFSPDGSRLIQSGAAIRVLDTANFATLEKVALSSWGNPVVSPDGRHVFVALTQKDAIAVFDVAENRCVPASTPRAWWRADGAADDVISGSAGELQGASFAPGRQGQAFGFNGYASAVSLHLVDYQEEFTVSMWLQFLEPAQSENAVVSRMPPAETDAEGWILLHTTSNTLRLCRTSGLSNACVGGLALDSGPLQPKVWYYVSVVKNGENWALYLNGKAAGQARLGQSKETFPAPLRLGAIAHRSALLGYVDELQLFNRALAASDIAAHYEFARCQADSE